MNLPAASLPPPASGEEKQTGVLERILFQNAENQFCIGELRLKEGKESITISGVMPNVQCGETLEIIGSWQQHPQYGAQFKVNRFLSRLPATVYGLRKYLGSGLVPGIGKVYANKIVDKFGIETLQVIETDSGRLREVDGIGPKRAKEIKAAWDEQHALREVMVFLQTYGITANQCLRLVREYGVQVGQILRSDPYQIAREIDGIGFRTADQIARNLGFSNDSPERIEAGLIHLLKERETEGHTGYPAQELCSEATELLEAPADLVRERLQNLLEQKAIRQSENSPLLQLPHIERAESKLAEKLKRLIHQPDSLPSIQVEKAIEWAQEQSGFPFGDAQTDALRMALTAKVSILTGGPGTGKTTILRALVQILRAKKVRILLASPTGRAAQRLSESTSHTAGTIHRVLKYDPHQGGFTVNEEHPLNCGYLIVDEASMLDNYLASALVRALPANAHLLLVGDVHQLPSVGAGNVLNDLIESNLFSVTRLDRIFRQREQSGIVTTAHNILQGDARAPYLIDSINDIDARRDFFFLRAPTPEACLERICEVMTRIPRIWPKLDAKRDVQLLAPMHRGTVGIANLNQILQQTLNPGARGIQYGNIRFQEGDKVIQTRNNYDKNLFNGDLGIITRVNPDAGTLAAEFDGVEFDFERLEISDLSPAYAITIHKSQGSEFPVVVIPLLKQHFMLLQRNLIYTAITRGKRRVILIGDPVAYAMAIQNTESRQRHTDLRRKLETP